MRVVYATPTAIIRPVRAIGRAVLSAMRRVGSVCHFGIRGVAAIFSPPWFPREILRQILATGFYSLPVVGLTALFTGAALGLNIYTGGGRFNAEQVMPQIVAIGLTRELGPVLAALMLAGRVSAAMAAEIGAMKATEQIDAMRTLSTDPMRYLIAPRILVATLALPVLTLIADIIGIAGGWLVAVRVLNFNSVAYIHNTLEYLHVWDVVSGLIKATVFGLIVALMGCYHGFTASGGARGVGRATTYAVVSSAVLIFASDYLLTTVFTHT